MKLRLQITKESGIRFISHLEYLKTLEKAIRRARIPVAYSQGFNPHMKFSLASALSVGVTSRCEFLEIYLREKRPLAGLVEDLRHNLPMGIHIIRADLADDKAPKLMAAAAGASYHVIIPCGADPASAIAAYEAAESAPYTKHHGKAKGKEKNKVIDAKAYIPAVSYTWNGETLELDFDIRITPTGSMKASEFLELLSGSFGLPLALTRADIARTDLYGEDANGHKRPLISEEEAIKD
jgi:radical SAM-linked protein